MQHTENRIKWKAVARHTMQARKRVALLAALDTSFVVRYISWPLCWRTKPLAAIQKVAWCILESLWTLQVKEESLTPEANRNTVTLLSSTYYAISAPRKLNNASY